MVSITYESQEDIGRLVLKASVNSENNVYLMWLYRTPYPGNLLF